MKAAIICILFSLVLGAIFSDAASQVGKAGGSSKNQKPVTSNQKMKPGTPSDPEEEKNMVKSPIGNIMELQNGNKKPSEDPTNCPEIFDPVCASDGKTYNNICLFGEAKKKNNGKLSLKHKGKC
ncbi:serine protease inhibitor Kazal-type 6-like [Sarcophilus harrisii]|uniref:serine protease inhibitor Kazal-type 6-like n=1 Tax=Sarcophilus harrisii TaxID=9305 RepID=UPI00062B96D4|nr:serine protease inhibitor Kazal-type 6-like [Sarcophilus harrisii]